MSEENSNHQSDEQAVSRIQRFSRSSVEHTDDLFKLKVGIGKRNISWKAREPNLVTYEHCHFFHSINDTTMQPNKYCTPTGGHFHEVTIKRDAKGEIVKMECGPALEMVPRKTGKGPSRRATPVAWESFLSENEQERLSHEGQSIPEFKLVRDNHTHELEYLGSEVFTAGSRQNRRQEEQAKVKAASVGQPVSMQPTIQNNLNSPNQAAAGLLKEVMPGARNDDGTDKSAPAGAQ